MRRAFLVLAVVFWAGTASAADAPRTGPAPAWVKPAELVRPPPGVPTTTAASRILLMDTQVLFGPSTDTIYFETLVRAQTSQGLDELGTVSVPWQPESQIVTVNKLNILRGDQVINVLADHAFTVLRRETNLESAVLDGTLTATLQVEGLQVGDILDLAATYARTDPIMKGRSEFLFPGPTSIPVDRMRLRAVWNRPKAIRWRAADGLDTPKLLRRGDTSELIVDMHNVEALVPPKDAPQRFGSARQIDFTEFASWADVSALFAPLYVKASTLAASSPLKAEAAKIRAASSDPAVRAAAALALVQDKVRYVFLGMNAGGLTPADADTTWSRRFGDCKGKTALLLALLDALGIEAQPALVSSTSGDGLESRLPIVGIFDHVLVRAVVAGKVYWLDGTRTGDRDLGSIRVPPYRWALPIQPSGAALVPLIQEALREPDTSQTLSLDASAGLSLPAPAHGELRLRSDAATELNLKIVNLAPADLDRAMREYWTKQYDFIEVKSVSAVFDLASGEERWTMDGVAKMAWDAAAGGNGERYEADGARLGWKAEFKRDPGPHSDAPFAVAFPSFERTIETIALPRGGEGFAIEGANIDRTVSGIAFLRTAHIDKGVFSMEASARSVAREFPASEAPDAAKSIREMWDQGLYVRAPAGYQETAAEVNEVLKSEPKTAAEFIDRGSRFMDTNAYAKARADFDRAIILDPSSAIAYADRSLASYWGGRFDLAKADAEKARVLNPNQETTLHALGLLALHEGRYSDAVAIFTRAIDQDSGDLFALEQRARLYWQHSDVDKGLADVAAALRLDPQWRYGRLLRADLFRVSGQHDRAKAELDAAVAARPYDEDIRFSRAASLALMGYLADARRDISLVIAARPTADAYLARARDREKTDVAGRLADVAQALKVDPKSIFALVMRSQIEVEGGHFNQAIAELSEAIKVLPEASDLRRERANAYAKAGQMVLALEDFASVRVKVSANATALNSLCWSEGAFSPILEVALGDCDAAIKLAPLAANIIDSRASVLLRLGRLDEALTAYDEALALRPDQAASLYGRGVVKIKKGLAKDGSADVAAALALDARVAEHLNEVGVHP